jgi:6-phosphofructokinase 1
VKLLERGVSNRVVGIRDNKLYDEDIVTACRMKKKFDVELYNMAAVVAR